jgi:hypothetical protein
MAFTNGQKMALFLLLSSRSALRFKLEGRTVGVPTPNPFPDSTSFLHALVGNVGSYNINPTDIPLSASALWVGPRQVAGVPDRQIANITTDHNEIVSALALDQLYTPDNPCPDDGREVAVATAVGALNL